MEEAEKIRILKESAEAIKEIPMEIMKCVVYLFLSLLDAFGAVVFFALETSMYSLGDNPYLKADVFGFDFMRVTGGVPKFVIFILILITAWYVVSFLENLWSVYYHAMIVKISFNIKKLFLK